MTSLAKILIPIQSDVEELERVMLGLLDSQVPFVKSVAEYVIQNGGKRLRPLLTLLCARMSGFQGPAAYKMGSCIEFIHTASLLHDDVIDNAQIRRGRASANNKWGNHVSVLVGDFFYCRASQLLTEQNNWKILKTVTDAITALTEGEVLEITTNADYHTSKDDYIKIIENKTAVLFAAACQVGGVLGNVSEEFELALRNYGFNLGVAFQLADDVLDYTSSEDVFGKQNGIDLQEGKLTLPLITALQNAAPEEAKIIRTALTSKHVEPAQVKEVADMIRKYKGFDVTWNLAKTYIETAKKSIEPFRNGIEKDILQAVANYVLARNF